ncbi:MAG: hypothetical protein CVV47_02740 [Spirochaetae bacterium HGW-Spirochaetae-3]|jgi:poly-gamma-glutamate synthesis protein (capsule biosynthesis protein)|nr:MAG: hypothetical protein CVV47_02740 [Spirochaetae bacterium HGW-Spirochaetae-3]
MAAFAIASGSCGFVGDATAAEAPTTAPLPDPATADTPAPPPVDRTFTVLACGDILLSRTPGKRAAEFGYRYLFEGIRDLVSAADISFANLETPAAYLGKPYPGKPENVTFRADPATLFGAVWAGFDVLSLANNHMNDYGPRAVEETNEFLDLLGVASCGAGGDIDEARSPAVLDLDGVRFAFLAYAEPIWSVIGARSAERAATRAEERLHGPIQATESPADPDSRRSSTAGVALAIPGDVLADIASVKRRIDPDYLFVSIHWGDEHQHIPNEFQKTLGRAAIDAGATAVLGHHPHVLQSVERYKGGLIAYSLGNLLFDMAADGTYETAALRFVVSKGRLNRVDIIPLRIARGTYAPAAATLDDAERRIGDIRRWSARFGTEIVPDGSTGHVFF